jgi:Tol biopolymer transport system component
VFVQREGAGSDLARARLADGAVRTLWRTADRDEAWPTWSDAAKRLAFQVGGRHAREPSDLWTWQPGQDEPSPIWTTPRRDEAWPAWSPVAAQLAFAFRGGAQEPGVAVVAFEGGAQVAVPIASVAPPALYLRPRFAPDGGSLIAQQRNGDDSELFVLVRGHEPRALTHDPAWFHLKGAFTRDGARVVFTRRPRAGGPSQVASVDLSGSDLRVLAGADRSDAQSGTPSPTRDEVAFVASRDGNFELYLVPQGGGAPTRLSQTPDQDEGAPHWSPDGERIAVTLAPREQPGGAPRRSEEALEGARVRVVDRSGQVLFEAPGLMPDWMPAW